MWKNVTHTLQAYTFAPMVACTKSDGVFQKRKTGHDLTMSHLGKGELSYWQPSGRRKKQVMQLDLHCTAWMELVPSRTDSNKLSLTVGVRGAVLQRRRRSREMGLVQR